MKVQTVARGMQPGTGVDWESELADLLGELSDVQQELLEILAAKRDCMAKGEVERMAELQPREEQLCGRLQACHQRRGGLLKRALKRRDLLKALAGGRALVEGDEET